MTITVKNLTTGDVIILGPLTKRQAAIEFNRLGLGDNPHGLIIIASEPLAWKGESL